jgi:hypothetical protein
MELICAQKCRSTVRGKMKCVRRVMVGKHADDGRVNVQTGERIEQAALIALT